MLLKESTENIENFISELEKFFPKVTTFKDVLIDFIEKSDCKKIEWSYFNNNAHGLALHDSVLINYEAKERGMEYVIFLIFHEIAHQYQFKKYGAEKMYDCYVGDISLDEATDFMRKTELVADEFARKKVEQLKKMGFIDKNHVPKGVYKTVPVQMLKNMMSFFRDKFKKSNVKSPEQISSTMYNMIKKQL